MTPLYLLRARTAAMRNTILSRKNLPATVMWSCVIVATLVLLYHVSVRLFQKVDHVDKMSTVLSTIQAVASFLDDRQPTIGEMLNRTIVMMFVFSLMAMLLLSNVISALSTFFASEELELIFSSPVRYPAVFFSRFVETAVQSSWMVLVVLGPLLAAFGSVYHAPPSYYVLFLVPLMPFVAYCTCAGVLLTIFLAKAFPVNRTRNLLRFLAVLGAGVLLMVFRIMRPELLVSPDRFRDFLGMLDTPWNPHLEHLPSGWAVKEILALMSFPLGATRVDHLALWGGAALAVVITYAVARRYHLRCWQDHIEGAAADTEALQAGGASPQAGDGRFAPGEGVADRMLFWLRQPSRSILTKDLRVFCRSPVIWTQVMLMLVIMVIYLYNIYLLPLRTVHGITPFFVDWLGFLNIGFVSFVVVALALRFGFPAISMEGPGFYLIHSSPVGIAHYVRLKFWSNYVPLTGISLVLVVASNQILGVRPALYVLSIVDAMALCLVISASALAFGAQYHDFRRQSLSEIPSSFGGMVFMVATLGAVVAIIGLQAVPFWYYTTDLAYTIARAQTWHWVLAAALGGASLIACFVLAWLSLRWSVRVLSYLEVC